MSRKVLFWLLAIFYLTSASLAHAQQPAKIPLIGYLGGTSGTTNSLRQETFRQGLRELGYIEKKTILIEWRYAEGKRDLVPALAAELVRLKPEVIVSDSATITRALKGATSTIPIVMTNDGDPVGQGFVASLANPGGNITGLSTLSPELSGKRLEILKETVPKLTRVAVFGTSSSASNALEIKEVDLAAGALGLKTQYLDVLAPKDFEAAFLAAAKQSGAVLMNVSGGIMSFHRNEIPKLAVKSKLPVTYHRPAYVDAGGLMSYGPNFIDLDRRAATFVDKLLKGRKPADLPVEQPMKFEFVVNLQAAKAIGLTIPPNVVVRADRVIK
jgi:putative ABC transport system substrate-binding protein